MRVSKNMYENLSNDPLPSSITNFSPYMESFLYYIVLVVGKKYLKGDSEAEK